MEFPLLEKNTTLGRLPDVKIPVLLKSKFGYQPSRFLLDTGADFSMLPAHIAEWLGIDLASCPKNRSSGIEGGKGVAVWLAKIQVKICRYELEIRCLFSENPACPYILGRADIFTHFNILFDNHANKIKLIKITP
ncbi:MAG: hypothetical protein COS29_00030 [Candidatus Omnitrophica bacterium CG02_land_8_20_14_3_00__42_8]|nr:MAG: hypothetical protein COS29_00030 [Candidatus Omnitrophica bacterium CG02_land_8_20_14_3_00__42_8]PIW67324.1 MAG: hypothetical protein COW10_06270 [Candidatus Omnitrophica bacterium CG12_big_fil_rev_8_21_14_0_65_42_8]